MSKKSGTERLGVQRQQYEHNRAFIIATQTVCGICGKPVDKSIKYPHPLSPSVDHIIPITKGGNSDIGNLQLTHWICNRMKSNKISVDFVPKKKEVIGNRNLPHLADWTRYRCKNE